MKILLIQQKMIGDVLVSSLLCEHLKNHFSDCTVHYLVNEHTTAVVENNPFIDEIVIFKKDFKSSKLKFYHFLQAISKENYEVVIDVYGKIESNLITFFSKAKIKIAYPKWYSKNIYTHLIPIKSRQSGSISTTVDDRLALLSPLIPGELDSEKSPKIYLSQREIDKARIFLQQKGVDLSTRLIMVGVVGSGTEKTYPFEYMAQVIDFVAQNTNAQLLFNYMPTQRGDVKKIYELCEKRSQNKIHLDAFDPELRNFLAILKLCDCYIGNEGGITNMAKALEVATFSIFAPWIDKKGWHTYPGTKNVAVHVEDYLPTEFSKMSEKQLRKETPVLYQLFKPSLFLGDLKCFLKK